MQRDWNYHDFEKIKRSQEYGSQLSNDIILDCFAYSNSNAEPMSADDLAKIVEEGRTPRSGKIGSAEIAVVRSRCTTDVVGRSA